MSISLSEHFTYKKLLRFVFPSIIMMIFTSIYSVVDGLFVSNFVGKTALAAINLIMPFIMGISALGFMIGTGGSAIVAKTLGEQKEEKAIEYFSLLVYATAIGGLILSLLGIIFTPAIARMLGAHGELLKNCTLYGRISFISMTAFMMQNVFQSFFVTAGKPKLGLYVIISAGVTNMVLDFLFIAVFHWGIAGAAIATVCGEFIGGIFPIFYFSRKNSSLLHLGKTKFHGRVLLQTCLNGSSELMTNVSNSIVSSLFNLQLMNYGAANHQELKNIFRKSISLIAVWGIALVGAAELLAPYITKLFVGYDAKLHAMTQTGFRICCLVYLINGFNIFGSSFFTALNNGPLSALISFLRTLIFQIAAVLLLPLLFGIMGIWWSINAAELLTLCVTLMLLFTMRGRYHYA